MTEIPDDQKRDSIFNALLALPKVDSKLLARPELEALVIELEDGEMPGGLAVNGRISVAVATDRRILYIIRSAVGKSIKEIRRFRYSEIESIVAGRGITQHPLTVVIDGNPHRIECEKDWREEFARYVSEKLPKRVEVADIQPEKPQVSGVSAALLGLCNEDEKILARPEVAQLISELEKGEIPGALATFGNQSVAVATDTRIIYVIRSTWGSSIKEVRHFSYLAIESIAAGTGITQNPVTVVVGGKSHRIECDKDLREEFARYVSEKLPKRVEVADIQPEKPQVSGVSAALLGLCSEDEKILARPEVAQLISELEEGEIPGAIAVNSQQSIAFATDRRVINITKSLWSKSISRIEDFTYDEIESITVGEGITQDPLTLVVSGKNHRIESGKEWLPPFARFVNMKLGLTEENMTAEQGSIVSSNERERLIDERWRQIKPPRWSHKEHDGERRMLYDLLGADERMERLIGGFFGPDLGQAKAGDTLHRGIALATDTRVLLVDKGIFSTEVAEMPYRNIEAITYSSGAFAAGLRITGRGAMSFRIENVFEKETVKPFIDYVRSQIEAGFVQPSQGGSAGGSRGPVSVVRSR